MLYIFTSYLFLARKKSLIVLFLLGLVLVSYLGSILISKEYEVNNVQDVLNVIFTSAILLIFIHGFNSYKKLEQIQFSGRNENLVKIVNVILILGLSVLLINIFITFKAFSALFNQSVNVTEYKNDGGAADMLAGWVNPILLLYSRLISPIGYLAFGLHFFFLLKKKKWFSFLFFLISLNIPLLGFHGLSRSAAVQFLLTYFFYLLYILPALSQKSRRFIFIFGGTAALCLLSLLNSITDSRFSKFYNIPIESTIQDPIYYSSIDYASQWNHNGIKVMGNFSYDKLMYGKSTLPIVDFTAERIGLEVSRLPELREIYLTDDYDHTFNGVVATLLYDFGYIFTFIFALVFNKFSRITGPSNGKVSLSNFMSFAFLIPLPLLFFSNNVYSNLAINIGVVFYIIFVYLLKRIKL
ncbi:oligosaccharide repeat unit polymerase [Nonlabens dokdonensis]|nr:O-antigen polymerase [Nonlabens dokdonensis]PZX39196.1 oligosaccharide repeat unit polymerase [Nonlabens dokdonensis]